MQAVPSQFSDLNLNPLLLRAIDVVGYKTPTPIQSQTIPIVMSGRDLIGNAQTGTGKTAAFALPILNRLLEQPRWSQGSKKPRVLVVSPTRELAVQIHQSFKDYAKFMTLKTAVIFGGVNQHHQVKDINAGLDVLIATPGRLLDLIQQRFVKLDEVEVFVLDEADRMLDMGFLPDVKRLVKLLPAKRQNLFFSATMPPAIKELANSFLMDPLHVKVDPVSSTAKKINQKVLFVDRAKKKDLLLDLLDDKAFDKVIVFTRTKHGANKLAEVLVKNRVHTQAIHGNKSQNARQLALQNLKTGKCRVLVATDIVARGIDIDQITHVINYDIPNDPESYVHRIGRTGRAGQSGEAISLCDADEKSYLRDIEKLTGSTLEIFRDHHFHSDSVENARVQKPSKVKAKIEGRRPFRTNNFRPAKKRAFGSSEVQR